MFKEGMQIAVLDSAKPKRGWHKSGENIFYYRSNVDHEYFRREKDSNVAGNIQTKNMSGGFSQLKNQGYT